MDVWNFIPEESWSHLLKAFAIEDRSRENLGRVSEDGRHSLLRPFEHFVTEHSTALLDFRRL